MTFDPQSFRGLSVALLTPMHEDGSIDEPTLRAHVDRMIAGGCDVLMPCGTTGEAATLSVEEQERVVRIVVEAADGRVPVVAGAGSNSTAVARQLAANAKGAGASGILAVTPSYNKPSQEGLLGHFTAIADAADGLPVVLYNVPGRTAVNLEVATTLRLAELDQIVGIKEATGTLDPIHTLLAERPEGFLVLAGDDILTLPALALGGDGVVSVAANEAPELMSRLVRSAAAGEFDEARRLHFHLLPLLRMNFVETNPVPVKTACHLMGMMRAEVRAPLAPLAVGNLARLEAVLHRVGLLGDPGAGEAR